MGGLFAWKLADTIKMWRERLSRTELRLPPEAGKIGAALRSTVTRPFNDDFATRATLVIESGRPPPTKIVATIAQHCRVKPEDLTIIFAPTQSLVGCTQIVARVLEVALHKAHALKFPLDRIAEGVGAAPLCPPHPDFITAMGRTNDAIIFAGRVQLFVSGPPSDACELAERLASPTSRDYGEPFAAIFERSGKDFYKIDPHLFSPAVVTLANLDTGRSFRFGHTLPRVMFWL